MASHHDDDRVRLGVVTGARGLRGDLWVKSFTADPRDLGAYGAVEDEAGKRAFDLRVKEVVKGKVVVHVEGVDDRTAAEALKGTTFCIPRERLPALEEEEYYHADLIGLEARLTDGTVLGTVAAVHDFGAGDVLDIAGRGRAGLMVPFTHSAVPEVDLDAGRVVVDPPPGLLDEPDGDGR